MCRSNFEDIFSIFVVPLYLEHVEVYFVLYFNFEVVFCYASIFLFSCEEVIHLKKRDYQGHLLGELAGKK